MLLIVDDLLLLLSYPNSCYRVRVADVCCRVRIVLIIPDDPKIANKEHD